MNLDETQKQQVTRWIEEGLKLSDIQSKLSSEFGLSMTYMEVRFLIDDLGVKLKDKPKDPPAPVKPVEPSLQSADSPVPAQPPGGGKVAVSVDQLTRPGSMVSGKVTFSDGKSAEWYLDQMGRLGVVPKEKDYKPSQEDVMEFQIELQNELARMGF